MGTEVPNMSTISIIGSGGMATAISGRIAKAGHTVEVVSRDPAKARALADKLAAGATTGKYGAAPAGDIVILVEQIERVGEALRIGHAVLRIAKLHSGQTPMRSTECQFPVPRHLCKTRCWNAERKQRCENGDAHATA